jgi:hypothetical protein
MPTSRTFAYNTGSSISGTEQIGNLAIGFPSSGFAATGLEWWNGPDEDLGYVITVQVPGDTQPTPIPGVTASVKFYRSTALTDQSFIDLAVFVAKKESNSSQSFATAEDARSWLNTNGYWTSYTTTWKYNSSTNLVWSDDTTGYTLLTGGVTSTDDGYWITPITIPTYYMNNQTSSNLYISTNAVVTLGTGYATCCPDTPQTSSNPALISGNAGDMFVQPGSALNDATIMNAYYRITQSGSRTKIELKVFQASLAARSTPYSYQLNLYRDSTYQWVETRTKTNSTGKSGPYNATDVSQTSSTTSKVWRGNLLGQSWSYLGTGSVNI